MASITDRVSDLGGYLREQRENARLSVRQLAQLAGVSNPYLSQVERGLRKPSAEVLQQIAKGLRISAEVLYVRAGILDSEGRPDVEAAIAADPALTDRQRRVLLDIYASFTAETLGRRTDQASAEDDDVAAKVPLTTSTPRRGTARTTTAGKTTARKATARKATARKATAATGTGRPAESDTTS